MSLLEVKNLSYSYPDGEGKRIIFENTSLTFEQGTFYAITGDSGSGKTTFLYTIAGLDTKYQGTITSEGKDIRKMGLDAYRRNIVAMIYQNFNLIPYLSANENLKVAMDISDNVKKIDNTKINQILEELGISGKKATRKSSSLSGGEQQRAAIGRALATDSKIIIADEPTGNLDAAVSQQVVELFASLAHDLNKCVIMVTHNTKLAQECDVWYQINQDTHKIEIVRDKNKGYYGIE